MSTKDIVINPITIFVEKSVLYPKITLQKMFKND